MTPRNIRESSFSFWKENRLPSLPSSFCGAATAFFLSSSFLPSAFAGIAGVVALLVVAETAPTAGVGVAAGGTGLGATGAAFLPVEYITL